jgi:hypothetical protein
VAACSDDVLGNMIQQLHAKDREQMNHPTNLASAYAIGLDYVHSNAANSSLK